MVENYTPSVMQITDGAVNKILSLADAENEKNNLNLRVYVTGGGCSGFQYGFSFDKVIDESKAPVSETLASLEKMAPS